MRNEPNSLGARLLDVEPVSMAHRQRLEQEIQGMFEQKLSRGGRIYWALSLVAAVAFAAWGVAVLAQGKTDGFLQAVWWVYTLANVGFVGLAAFVLWTGTLNVRRLMDWAKLSPALTLAIVVLLVARAAARPTTESVLWVLFGVVCLVVALSIMVFNRVVMAELSQREQGLRVELRLVELAERLGTERR